MKMQEKMLICSVVYAFMSHIRTAIGVEERGVFERKMENSLKYSHCNFYKQMNVNAASPIFMIFIDRFIHES